MSNYKHVLVPYTVKAGDTLPGLALHFLGGSHHYSELLGLNSNLAQAADLQVGSTIMIPVPLTSALMESVVVKEAMKSMLFKEYPANVQDARKVYLQICGEITYTGNYDADRDASSQREGIAVLAQALGILSHSQFLEEMKVIKKLFH